MTAEAPKCSFCGSIWGFTGGIMVRSSFICIQCEKNIIASDAGSPRYSYYVRGLKKIWRFKTV